MTARQKPSLPNLGAHEEFTAAFKEEKKKKRQPVV